MSQSSLAHVTSLAHVMIRAQAPRLGLGWLISVPRRAIGWLGRVARARRDLEMLAAFSEAELKDIGLTLSDIGDATALAADASPTDFLAQRIEERHQARRG